MWYTYGFASDAVSSVKDRTSTMISFCDSISFVEILQIILIVKQIVLLFIIVVVSSSNPLRSMSKV